MSCKLYRFKNLPTFDQVYYLENECATVYWPAFQTIKKLDRILPMFSYNITLSVGEDWVTKRLLAILLNMLKLRQMKSVAVHTNDCLP